VNTTDAMIWFLSTAVGFILLMSIGIFLAVHTYDKHASDPHHHRA
jgi:hypothetical protein